MKYFAIVLASVAVLIATYEAYQLRNVSEAVAFEHRNWRKQYFCEAATGYMFDVEQWLGAPDIYRKKNCEFRRCKNDSGEITQERIRKEEVRYLSSSLERALGSLARHEPNLGQKADEEFPISVAEFNVALEASYSFLYDDGDYDIAMEEISNIAKKRQGVVEFCRRANTYVE